MSKVGSLLYTPAGIASFEFTLAVSQSLLDHTSMGYFDVQVLGDEAENKARQIRIGKKIQLEGKLWSREYRNREGVKVSETKVLADVLELSI